MYHMCAIEGVSCIRRRVIEGKMARSTSVDVILHIAFEEGSLGKEMVTENASQLLLS